MSRRLDPAGEAPPPRSTSRERPVAGPGPRPIAPPSFDDAAPYYDRTSRLIGFGSGGWYRRWSLSRAGLVPGMAVLDVGTGTGAVAAAAVRLVRGAGRVVGVDPSRGMLRHAVRTLALSRVQGIAEALPFQAATFDFVSLGYSLRYVADVEATLRECHRVLRPGGILLILDLAVPRSRLGYRVARFYLETAVPWLATGGANHRDAAALLRYCWSTVDRSVRRETLEATLERCGLRLMRRTVWFGFLSEHVAVKP